MCGPNPLPYHGVLYAPECFFNLTVVIDGGVAKILNNRLQLIIFIID